ncbi:hypothetical protein GCM10027447_03720 [Glycomyces halotolerans]
MAQREFDPDEANHYKAVLEAELEYIEGEIIPLMKEGVLSYAPAFGLTDEAGKAGEYEQDFNNIWMDIQNLKATLKGMIDVVEQALEGHELTEEANVAELNVYDLQGIHSTSEGDSEPPDYTSLGGNQPV